MKKHSYVSYFAVLLAFILTVGTNVIAQPGWITEVTVIHNDDARSALSAKLMADPKTVKKAWKDFLGDHYDMDVDGIGFLSNKDILTTERIYLPGQKDHKLDLFAKVVPANTSEGLVNTEMMVFASYGYDMYVNRFEHKKAHRQIKTMFDAFLDDFLPGYYEESLENAEDKLGDLQKDRQDLIDRNEEIQDEIRVSYSEIKMLKEDIADLEEERENNKSEMAEIESRIEAQDSKLEKIQGRYEATATDTKKN